MEIVYHKIGVIVFWLSAALGSSFVFYFLIKTLFNRLAESFKIFWVILEFVYYKNDFLEWVKDKKRHPKAE